MVGMMESISDFETVTLSRFKTLWSNFTNFSTQFSPATYGVRHFHCTTRPVQVSGVRKMTGPNRLTVTGVPTPLCA